MFAAGYENSRSRTRGADSVSWIATFANGGTEYMARTEAARRRFRGPWDNVSVSAFLEGAEADADVDAPLDGSLDGLRIHVALL